ncbi:GLPGLI family protein [uncultured Flavobacterium sp.]|uniref:GLPGLI family protein n=1 Tax=uncultured Flavobacterium sp. TaxID=165435 RepID=UPI0025E8F785|nr:GLPGLI family protein [uncultured Flavobacterium sp.]
MIKVITNFVLLASLFCFGLANAQDFHGQAVYESKTLIGDKIQINSADGMPEDMKQKLQESMKKAFEKTFVLNFNKYESVYLQEEKLEAPKPNSSMNVVVFKGNTDGKKYKNVKEKIQIAEEDVFGKEFLIVDSLKVWNWKLESESKKIGNYTCYKAVAVIPVSEEDLKQYEESKKLKGNGKTQFITISEPKEQIITVWYAPEIPVSQGPDEYWGLPGLILEANDGHTIFLCSKITLNSKEKTEIKRPNKGKKVNQKEYDRIVEKQMENMKDSKGNINIKIGG